MFHDVCGCKTEGSAVVIVFSQLCCQAEQYNSSYKPAHSPVPAGLGTLVTGDD